MINVTKSFLPELKKYIEYLEGIWERGHLTNHGPLVLELEEKIKSYLGVKHFFFLNNGTIAIQIAIKALNLSGEIITTPFSYVATTSSIVWEGCKPVFVDITPVDLTIDVNLIEAAISNRTRAILATHVYGIPCAVEQIEVISKKYGIPVIYDAAHAFGVKFKGTGILNYGDISTLSFHATKLFHTVEGGGIATNDDELAHRISYLRNFGHNGQEAFWGLGVNGKSSEFHAAMGLCVFPYINELIEKRSLLCAAYDKYLGLPNSRLYKPLIPDSVNYNFAYYPILFQTESEMLKVRDDLNRAGIFPRRYFYPSLNNLPYLKHLPMPIADSVSSRVLCLPLYFDLQLSEVETISTLIINTLSNSL